ncbi:GNAT family N-acetyltransferase [Limimaricola soesokkakensis]|uniref:GNAT family N-acetyltransferase n=1 Tax=Limimaricola soesokkakensis TaxID=1343159 RepID=UPI003512F710
MRLRLARAADRDRIDEIVTSAYAPYIPLIGHAPAPMRADYGALIAAGVVHLTDESGPSAALMVLLPQPDHLLLDNIAVHADAQGRGLGRALLGAAEDMARQAGLPEIRLYTNAAMQRNLRIYAMAGYKETRRAHEQGFHRVFMSKRLS